MNSSAQIMDYEQYREKKPHGELGFPFSVYHCEIPRLFREVLPHWHEEMEMIYIRKGRGCVSVDLERRILSAPAIVLVLPGQLHSIVQHEQDYMEYENILFGPDFLLSRDNELFDREYLMPLFEGMLQISAFLTEDDPAFMPIAEILDSLENVQEAPLLVKSQLYLLSYRLQALFPLRSRQNRDREVGERLKSVLTYVKKNYAEPIRIADAAAQADFSESHFMRFFKEHMGMSFVNYLKNYRLSKAEELVRSSDHSILEIAQDCGFSNFSYFIREFKTKYGQPPLKYRGQMGDR